MIQGEPVEVFVSYAHRDSYWRNRLEKHLSSVRRGGLISVWYDGLMLPGQTWEAEILQRLERANVVVLLLSADFMASEYVHQRELSRALERHRSGDAIVIPVLLHQVRYEDAAFAALQPLPLDARNQPKPVTNWRDRNEALKTVVDGIVRAVDELQASAGRSRARRSEAEEPLTDGRRERPKGAPGDLPDPASPGQWLRVSRDAGTAALQARSEKLVELLRRKLSERDARDIGNDFGQRVGLGVRLYDRLSAEGPAARISALVAHAQQLDKLFEFVVICGEYVPDLQAELTALAVTADDVGERHAPHNLPPRRGRFIGRRADLERVREGLASRFPVISIEGLPGVGKTFLAIEAGYACLSGAWAGGPVEYVVWVSAADRRSPHGWLHEILNVAARVMNHFSLTQLPLEELDSKRAEVENLLRSHRVLVVIDSFEAIEDRELVSWIERIPEPSQVLITTQRGHPRGYTIPLRGLEEGDAVELLRQEADASALTFIEHKSDEALLPLVQATDGNPHALVMAIGIVKGGNLSLEEVVDQLRQAGEGVEEIFTYLFERSWAFLDEAARAILLSVPLFVGSMSKDALETVSDLGEGFGRGLQTLVNAKLLDVVDFESHRYTVHPLTRAFVGRRLEQEPRFAEDARERWALYYLGFVERSVRRVAPDVKYWDSLVSDGMAAVDLEWPSILQVMEWADRAGRQELLLDFVLLLVHYMDSRFYNLERMIYVKKAVEAAGRLGRREDEAILLIDALGWTYVEENRFAEAEEAINAGLDVAGGLDQAKPAATDAIALGLAWLARMSIEQGRKSEAAEWINRALETPCRPWIKYRVTMAAGDIALKESKSREALRLYESAVEQYQTYGGEGHGYQIEPRIGLAYLGSGALQEAQRRFQALRKYEQIAIGRLYADYGVALVAFRQGDVDEARRLAHATEQRMSRRTTSNLLLTLLDNLFKDLEAGHLTSDGTGDSGSEEGSTGDS
jgi:LuxR family glucitol operon transcriptional activator